MNLIRALRMGRQQRHNPIDMRMVLANGWTVEEIAGAKTTLMHNYGVWPRDADEMIKEVGEMLPASAGRPLLWACLATRPDSPDQDAFRALVTEIHRGDG